MSLRNWLAPALVAATAIMPLAAASQAPVWPARAIHIVVPYGPGGYTDTYTRLIAAELAKTLNQPVLVENKPGNSGNVGSEVVAKAAPDGYTLLMGGMSTHAINVTLYRNLPFDPVRDFTPVAPAVWASSVLLVNPATNLATVGELIALARSKPGELAYGSAGIGTPGHLNVESLKGRTGVRLNHLPYKGETDALLALIRGDIVLGIDVGVDGTPAHQGRQGAADRAGGLLAVTDAPRRAPPLGNPAGCRQRQLDRNVRPGRTSRRHR